MIYSIRCVIIFLIAAKTNCEQIGEEGIIELPVRVYIVPPNNIEFQFEKNDKIEPIALREDENVFYLSDSDTTINFRDPKSIKQGDSYRITVALEYRYPGTIALHNRTFQHEFRHNPEDVIIVRFPPPSMPQLPQTETCTSQNCGNSDTDLPQHLLDEQVDAPRKSIEETTADALIDRETLEESCDNDYGYTEELLKTALRHSQIGTRLLLKDFKDTKTNPVDAIRNIIAQELNLPSLEYNILQAKFIDEGLLFEMQSTKDVVEILRQSQIRCEEKKDAPKIELTTKSFYDYKVDVRFGDA